MSKDTTDEKVKLLKRMLEESRRVVFFGGAGVSTESGIPDFRSTDGLYHQKYKYPPEEILSGEFLRENPEEFFRFYHDKLTIGDVEPNVCHRRLAQLEEEGKLTAVITQNIDGLHQMAGSKNVLELHGTIHRCYCPKCGTAVPEGQVNDVPGVPRCQKCGGVLRPDVVLYGEGLDSGVMMEAVRHIEQCDMLIIGGTSLVVYPAAGLIRYFRGKHLVLINRDPTPMDSLAELCLNMKLGEVFSQI